MKTRSILFNFTAIILLVVSFSVKEFTPVAAAPLAAPVCASSGPSGGAYTVNICISAPAANATLTGNATVTATATVTGTNPGIQRMIFYLTGGTYLLTDYQSPYTFTLPTTKWQDGVYALSVAALMRDGFTTQQTLIGVTFSNGNSSPPVNGNTFHPTSGRPANGSPYTVIAVGDGASGETNATNVVNMVASRNPNLLLYLGDVYEKGSVAEFFNWYGNSGSNFSAFKSITDPTIGNHEYSSSSSAVGYFNYWDNIPNYYSFNANGWHFISLNSNYTRVGVDQNSPQYQWLQQDLAANSNSCTIVYFHHPLFNIGPEGSTSQISPIWSLLVANKVEIVLNGHDHTYQRWVPMDGSGQPIANGTTEFVVGGSGHGLQTISRSDSRVAYSSFANPTTFGALELTLNTSGASYKYVNTSNTVLDSGTITCLHIQQDNQAPTIPANLTANAVSHAQVNLAWSASTDNVGVSGYRISRNGSVLTTVSGSSLTYNDTSVTPATQYTYTVDSYDAAGNHSAQSSPAVVTTPAMPTSLTFAPVADTYVSASNPATNYGSATTIRLDGSPDLHGYLRFQVQGTFGSPVSQATLRLYTNTSLAAGFQAQAVADTTWGEKTVNYNTAPALGNLISTSGAITANSWVNLDVTPLIAGDGLYSIGIRTLSSSAMSLQSKEATTNQPQLILTFGSAPPPDTQAPSVPGNLTGTAVSSSEIDLSWTASTDNIGVVGYDVFRNGTLLVALPNSSLAYQDTGLSPATLYSYAVDAYDQAGNHSTLSPTVGVTTNAAPDITPPSIPTSLTAVEDSVPQVLLNWGASTDNIGVTGYSIMRDGTVIGTVSGSTLTYSDATISPSSTYSYTVDAFDQAGNHSAPSNTAVITTSAPPPDTEAPSIPGGITAVSNSPSSVDLGWSAATDNVGVTGYTVYRDGASINTVSGSTLNYTDGSVSPATTYTYTVDAYDAAGNHSAQSNPVDVTTQSLPATLSFSPNADTYVNGGSTGSNYGNSTTLRVDASPDLHSYIRFNVQGTLGRPVVHATLRIFINNSSSQGIQALAVADNSWGEKTMNYTNMPALGSVLASSGAIPASSWVLLDVTGYVTGDGQVSFGVTTPSSTANSFPSRENASNPPQLVLDFQ